MSNPEPSWPDDPPGSSGEPSPPGQTGGSPHQRDAGVCTLCGSSLGAADARCGACGMVVGVAKPAASPFSHGLLWALAGGIGVIYVLVLGLVAALR